MPAFTQFNLAYIEEDPNDKNLLRLQPICSEEGVFTEEDCLALFPDKGYLRIVPDKKEKTTFKNRLRKTMPFCALRLSDSDEAQNKIRPNRNYHIQDEYNQQVVYSDAITPLPKDFIYEVITLSIKEKLSSALESIAFGTPKGYIQRGNDWYGPFTTPPKKLSKKTERPPSYSLFAFSAKDKQYLFYFPALEELYHQQKDVLEKESLPIGKPLNILDSSLDFDEQLANLTQPLNLSQGANLLKAPKGSVAPSLPREAATPGSGTPLYARASTLSSPQPKSQSLEQIVANQLHFSPAPSTISIEEGPSFSLSAFAKDPAQLAAHLQMLAALPNFHKIATGVFSNQPINKWQTFVFSAFTQQLETLEAERLSLVMQLDRAKDQLDKLIKTTLAEKEEKMTGAIEELRNTLAALEEEKLALLKVEEQLLASIAANKAEEGNHSFSQVQQAIGHNNSLAHVVHHSQAYMQNAGYEINKNQLLSLLYSISANQKITIVHENKSLAYRFFQDFLKSLSWETLSLLRRPDSPITFPPSLSQGTPYFILYNEWIDEPLPSYCKAIFFSENAGEFSTNSSFHLSPWPLFLLNIPINFSKHLQGQPFSSLTPTSCSAVESWFPKDAQPFPESHILIEGLVQNLPAFPFAYTKALHDFIAATANFFEGGIASAIDGALALYLVPYLLVLPSIPDEITALLKAFPAAELLWEHKRL